MFLLLYNLAFSPLSLDLYAAVTFAFLTPLYWCPCDCGLAEYLVPEKKRPSLGGPDYMLLSPSASLLALLSEFLSHRE